MLSDPENFEVDEENFNYNKTPVAVNCENDSTRCSKWFKDAIDQQSQPDYIKQADTTPLGREGEGNFTYTSKRDDAQGTLDFFHVVVDRGSLNMTEENFEIIDDAIKYSHNGVEISC